MRELEHGALARHTPCTPASDAELAVELAEVHAELVLVHPFREGNGRRAYFAGIHAALGRGSL